MKKRKKRPPPPVKWYFDPADSGDELYVGPELSSELVYGEYLIEPDEQCDCDDERDYIDHAPPAEAQEEIAGFAEEPIAIDIGEYGHVCIVWIF